MGNNENYLELFRTRHLWINSNSGNLLLGQKKTVTWESELRNSLTTISQLESYFQVKLPKVNQRVLLPRKFAKKIKNLGEESSLWKQFIPDKKEMNTLGLKDPIGDQNHKVSPHLIHRYKNKVLFLPTNYCPISCRYCFRKNELEVENLFQGKFQEDYDYLKQNKSINEVIFSGGDPLILSDKVLNTHLEKISKINHIQHIRFHTKMPIILPERLTSEFLMLLLKYKSYFRTSHIVLHINHLEELSQELIESLKTFKKSNILLSTQTVLLREVNDNADTLSDLFLKLYSEGIRPYYLHHPDLVNGGMHFYLLIEKGIEIYSEVKQLVPGPCLPRYVLDIPGGFGKVPLTKENLPYSGHIKDYQGRTHKYPNFC